MKILTILLSLTAALTPALAQDQPKTFHVINIHVWSAATDAAAVGASLHEDTTVIIGSVGSVRYTTQWADIFNRQPPLEVGADYTVVRVNRTGLILIAHKKNGKEQKVVLTVTGVEEATK